MTTKLQSLNVDCRRREERRTLERSIRTYPCPDKALYVPQPVQELQNMIYVKMPGMKPFQFSHHRSASSPATVLHRYLYPVRVPRGNITLLFEEMSVPKFGQRTAVVNKLRISVDRDTDCRNLLMSFSDPWSQCYNWGKEHFSVHTIRPSMIKFLQLPNNYCSVTAPLSEWRLIQFLPHMYSMWQETICKT